MSDKHLALILAAAVLVCVVVINAHAQEGNTATVARVHDTEQTWRRTALIVPGPAWGGPLREAVPDAPRARQNAIQKIVEESSRCRVDWHSQRAKRPSRISCWR